jgi:hypothetical protein
LADTKVGLTELKVETEIIEIELKTEMQIEREIEVGTEKET